MRMRRGVLGAADWDMVSQWRRVVCEEVRQARELGWKVLRRVGLKVGM
jgi:hypothetical protein